MNRTLYSLVPDNPPRCRCTKASSLTKKRKRSEGKPLQYPDTELSEIFSKTFHMKYQGNLSPIAKFILNSFQEKYIYYAIDDILYSLQSNPIERENLLAVLYSPILSLQNNFSINFFDIWIKKISIDERSKTNKFLKKDSEILEKFHYITIELFYTPGVPAKKRESLW